MSFFGFDTTLPPSSLDEKLASLRAGGEDLEVYEFGAEENGDLYGGGGGGSLELDEGINELNDETFGLGDNVGKDFDFVGSTSQFLSHEPPAQHAQGLHQHSQPFSGFATSSVAAQKPLTSKGTGPKKSTWNDLDADPLLGPSRGLGAGARTASSSSLTSHHHAPAVPPPAAAKQQQQQQQQAQPRMRTLEEIEAEIQAQARQRAQQQQQQPATTPSSIVNRGPQTLEEIEAELMRSKGQGRAQQDPSTLAGRGSPFGQQQPPQPHPGLAHHTGVGFDSQSGAGLKQMMVGGGAPTGLPGFPVGPLGIGAQGGRSSPFVEPPRFAIPPQPPQPARPNDPLAAIGGMGRPALPVNPQQQQQLLIEQQRSRQAGHTPSSSLSPFPASGPPIIQGPRGGAPGGLVALANQILSNLKAPLHQNLYFTQIQILLSQIQQLLIATQQQPQPPPQLQAAQLQIQNLVAQVRLLAQKGDPGGARAGAGDAGAVSSGGGAIVDKEIVESMERRIREHERMEIRRRWKAGKIASMSKYNNIMSQGDKNFITRIQVSQLVTEDPYTEDFYYQVVSHIRSTRLAAASGPLNAQIGEKASGPGGGGGGGGGNGKGGERKLTRRENAMVRMAQQVQRIVDNAQKRPKMTQLSLEGALGKIALRTRSAPRQLLQVSTSSSSLREDAATSAQHRKEGSISVAGAGVGPEGRKGTPGLGGDGASGAAVPGQEIQGQRPPLTRRQALVILEQLYDTVLELEQLRRTHHWILERAAALQNVNDPGALGDWDANQALEEWRVDYSQKVEEMWSQLRVVEPLDISYPHPFVSLISVSKGKCLLTRVLRHTSPEQTLTLLTMVVACFGSLDVVRDSYILDSTDVLLRNQSERSRADVEKETEIFLNAVVPPMMETIGNTPLRVVSGMLGLLMERNDVVKIAQSRPGVAFFTAFLSRAELLQQGHGALAGLPAPDEAELQQWRQVYDTLFARINQHLPSFFPSTRVAAALPFGSGLYSSASLNTARPTIDLEDEPVWQFLAAFAVCANMDQQQMLVASVREKVLENVTSATKKWVTPEVAALKIRNVNLMLNALGLDSSQITVDGS